MEIPSPIGGHAKSEAPSLKGLYIAETQNLVHEPYETNDEIKALTQEVIKTIRDIIVRCYSVYAKQLSTFSKLNVHKLSLRKDKVFSYSFGITGPKPTVPRVTSTNAPTWPTSCG